MSTDLTDDELMAMWNAESIPVRTTSECVRAFARAAIAADRNRRASSAAAVPAELGADELNAASHRIGLLLSTALTVDHPAMLDWARIAFALRKLAATPAPPQAAGQADTWREHVEQRIRSWSNSTMNESGDRLAIDDFMDAESLDDLIDFVCDEWSGPGAKNPDAPPQAVPATDAERLLHGLKFAREYVRKLPANTGYLNAINAIESAIDWLSAAPVAVDAADVPEADFGKSLALYANPLNWAEDENGIRRVWMEPGSSTPTAYNGFELARAALRAAGAGSEDTARLDFLWERMTASEQRRIAGDKANCPQEFRDVIDAARGKA